VKLSSVQAVPLAYFLEVAQRGSISAASQTLHVAVSAISRQIGRLESDLGMALFHRTGRGMALTEAGALVQRHARRALLEAETLQSELDALRGLERSTIRLACTDGFAQDYLPAVITHFRRAHPGVVFALEVCAPAVATRLVREGEADVALTFTIAAQEGVHVAYSEPAPIFAHMADAHPLAGRREVSMRELVAYPVVLPSAPNIVRQLFDLVCGLEDLRPTVLLSSNSLASLTGFLHYDQAINFCGSLSVRNRLRAQRQTLVPIGDREMQQRVLQVQTMAGRSQSPAVRAFIETLVGDIRKRRRGLSTQRRAPR